jgi:hypothetical protein
MPAQDGIQLAHGDPGLSGYRTFVNRQDLAVTIQANRSPTGPEATVLGTSCTHPLEGFRALASCKHGLDDVLLAHGMDGTTSPSG